MGISIPKTRSTRPACGRSDFKCLQANHGACHRITERSPWVLSLTERQAAADLQHAASDAFTLRKDC